MSLEEKQKQARNRMRGFLIAFVLCIAVGMVLNLSVQQENQQSQNTANAKKTKANIDEKKALLNSYFGNFSQAEIRKKSGKATLEVWQPWVQHVKQNFGSQFQKTLLSGTQKITIVFDEIWIAVNNENLTENEKRKYEGNLDILKLYWKGEQVQAYSLEKLYKGNPVSGAKLDSPSHKVTNIYERSYILEKIK
jgi:uncharacterized membrane-anchored protein YhcB (DUF1043 family)